MDEGGRSRREHAIESIAGAVADVRRRTECPLRYQSLAILDRCASFLSASYEPTFFLKMAGMALYWRLTRLK
jgi:hypothetical protein